MVIGGCSPFPVSRRLTAASTPLAPPGVTRPERPRISTSIHFHFIFHTSPGAVDCHRDSRNGKAWLARVLDQPGFYNQLPLVNERFQKGLGDTLLTAEVSFEAAE